MADLRDTSMPDRRQVLAGLAAGVAVVAVPQAALAGGHHRPAVHVDVSAPRRAGAWFTADIIERTLYREFREKPLKIGGPVRVRIASIAVAAQAGGGPWAVDRGAEPESDYLEGTVEAGGRTLKVLVGLPVGAGLGLYRTDYGHDRVTALAIMFAAWARRQLV